MYMESGYGDENKRRKDAHGKRNMAFYSVLVTMFIGVVLVVAMLGANKYNSQTTSRRGVVSRNARSSENSKPHIVPITRRSPAEPMAAARLPTDLQPYHQNIELRPNIYSNDPADFDFNGKSEIYFNVTTATDKVEVNAKQLRFVESSIEVSEVETGTVIGWTDYDLNEEFYTLTLTLSQKLAQGTRYKLSLEYTGELQQDFVGLYWDSYESAFGARYLVATQFQPTNARKAFPCFDEPGFKSTFNVTILRRSWLTSISNMPILTTQHRDGWLADVYETTPVMSTYLLAFVVSDYTNVHTTSSRGTRHRIWVRQEAVAQAQFALESSTKIVDWLTDYTGIEFPLPKLDHIALPNKGGAMENWGLITYSEGGLLFDESIDNPYIKYLIGGLMGHETAHMWFGNIVTCKWWTHAWLNEGFATLFSNPSFLYIDPSFQADEYSTLVAQDVMTLDSSFPNVPVVVDVQHPDDASLAFGPMTYRKGASIGRMLQYIMTPESFRKGINRYLTRHLYGNTVTDDLWSAMTEQASADGIKDTDGSALDIKSKMDSWVLQVGFPKISVTRNANGTVSFNQYIYLQNPNEAISSPSPFNYTWNVPVSYTTSEERNFSTSPRVWMNRDNITVSASAGSNTSWIWLNNEHIAYFRVDYDNENRNNMISQLVEDQTVIPSNNRIQLIADMYVFTSAGMYKEVDAIATTRFLGAEQDVHVWSTALTNLEHVDTLLRFRDSFPGLQRYMRKITDPVYSGINWNDGNFTYNAIIKRSLLFSAACAYGNPDCLSKSQELLQQWVDTPNVNPIRTDLRRHVYCYGLASPEATQADWNFVYDQYVASTNSIESGRLADGLVCTQNEDLMIRLLDSSLAAVDPAHISNIWWGAASSPVGRPYVWDHLRDDWSFTPLGALKTSVLTVLVSSFSTENQLEQLENFIEANPPESDLENSTFSAALNTVKSNIEWVRENEQDLEDFFDREAPGFSGVGDIKQPIGTWQSMKPGVKDRMMQLAQHLNLRNKDVVDLLNKARFECLQSESNCAFIHEKETYVPL